MEKHLDGRAYPCAKTPEDASLTRAKKGLEMRLEQARESGVARDTAPQILRSAFDRLVGAWKALGTVENDS